MSLLGIDLETVAANSVALLVGAITRGFLRAAVTGLVWWFDRRTQTAQNLLAEGIAIYSLQEAWLLEGPSFDTAKISGSRGLISTQLVLGGLWLRRVEVRAVFDESQWNSPERQFYEFLEGRRTWIVRDTILTLPPSYPTWTGGV